MDEHTHSILIAEDEVPMLNGLRDTFTKAGFKVFIARNGQEALAGCDKHKPDVILLDIIMPVMDGLEALKKIREHEWGKTIPIVLLTNLTPNDRILKVIVDHQPSFYLIKTKFTMSEVLDKVKEAIAVAEEN